MLGSGADCIPNIEGRLRAIAMSPDELRINREILEDIGRRKRGFAATSESFKTARSMI